VTWVAAASSCRCNPASVGSDVAEEEGGASEVGTQPSGILGRSSRPAKDSTTHDGAPAGASRGDLHVAEDKPVSTASMSTYVISTPARAFVEVHEPALPSEAAPIAYAQSAPYPRNRGGIPHLGVRTSSSAPDRPSRRIDITPAYPGPSKDRRSDLPGCGKNSRCTSRRQHEADRMNRQQAPVADARSWRRRRQAHGGGERPTGCAARPPSLTRSAGRCVGTDDAVPPRHRPVPGDDLPCGVAGRGESRRAMQSQG
jgi:hypothetical protein